MIDDDLTTSDVLLDPQKNLCHIYENNDDNNEEDNPIILKENLYYTECEFSDFLTTGSYGNDDNLTILSLNVGNLLSKLSSLKLFIAKLQDNRPDIIIVTETHISNLRNGGYDRESLKHLIQGYGFFHEGRGQKRGGGGGYFCEQ